MPEYNDTTAPHLVVWAAVLAAAACLVVFITRLPSKEQLQKREMQSWVLRNTSIQKNAQLVVVLGTSLTGAGLDSAAILQSRIGQLTGKNIQVMKLWQLDAGPETFSEISSALVTLHPSVAVVEANMLFYFFQNKKGWPRYTQRFRDMVNGREEKYAPDAKPIVLDRTIKAVETFRSGLRDTCSLAGFAKLLQTWQSHGTKVILLNFPLEASMEEKKWKSPDTAAFYRNVRYLGSRCILAYDENTAQLDERYFIDHAHMNRAGEQRQSVYFSRLIATKIAGQ